MLPLAEEKDGSAQITAIDPPARRLTFRIIMTIVALEPLIIFIVLWMVGVPPWAIACIFGFGALLLVGIFWLITAIMWKPWQKRYPPQPILPGAVSQSWQSFAFGMLARLNNCLTIVADERHIHLLPFAPFRMMGAKAISLPLDRMRNVRRATIPALGMTAELDDRTISGPEWCLSLAGQNAEEKS